LTPTIRTDEPPANAFTHRFEVLASDIDDLGHAGNVSWVRFINDAAAAHSRAIGLDLEAYRKLGLLWVVRRHDVLYLGPAYAGEALQTVTWIDSARGASSIRKSQVHRTADGALLLRAETTWVLIVSTTGKPTRIPPELMHRYGVL
jgi:acyl-CoA thioester hydrolase